MRRSQVFAGNVREHHTLAEMLEALNAPRAALVVMDRGIATEDRVRWLRDEGYRYLVVSRERTRHFDAQAAVRIETASSHGVHLHKVRPRTVVLLLRRARRQGTRDRRALRQTLRGRAHQALRRAIETASQKRLDKVWQRIGRLKAQSRGIAQHYAVELDTDKSGQRATAVRFTRRPLSGSMMTHPGVYCLRSRNRWDEATLRTYFILTDEAVFRSLKSELGLRPIYHHKPVRAEGHLFITVIAYQLVQVIRRRLRESRDCELDHASPDPGRPATHHRHLPPCRRAYAALVCPSRRLLREQDRAVMG